MLHKSIAIVLIVLLNFYFLFSPNNNMFKIYLISVNSHTVVSLIVLYDSPLVRIHLLNAFFLL